MGTLAEMENVRPGTMSRMVDVLVDNGMATRRENRNDRRGVLVAATTKGIRVYQRANHEYSIRLGGALSRKPELLTAISELAAALQALSSKDV